MKPAFPTLTGSGSSFDRMSRFPGDESTLLIEVPEADPLVGRFRHEHDPVARLGIPAHITVLYPFIRPDAIGPEICQQLTRLLLGFEPFRFHLTHLNRFSPTTLWLAPSPSEPFSELTVAVLRQFPGLYPYGDPDLKPIPHVTIADRLDETRLDAIDRDFARTSAYLLPVESIVKRVTLMTRSSGRWESRISFGLGT